MSQVGDSDDYPSVTHKTDLFLIYKNAKISSFICYCFISSNLLSTIFKFEYIIFNALFIHLIFYTNMFKFKYLIWVSKFET